MLRGSIFAGFVLIWRVQCARDKCSSWVSNQMQNMDRTCSAPEIVAKLLAEAEQAGASDVHLQATGDGAEVTFRLDGVITPVCKLPADVAPQVFGRIKYLARLKTYQESLPQDGRIDKTESGLQHEVRVATYPTVTGEKIVIRLFQQPAVCSLSELGLGDAVVRELETVLRRDSGLVLLTGPAGSGKTTTIYACLTYLVSLGGRHIITVEDPVERIIPGVMQTEVNEARGLTFAVAARHLLRQDPQVLVLGEIRDEGTAALAIRAALTGHLVISTLHAGSCKGVFERLMVMCSDQYAVTSSIEMVLNQRLMRKLCHWCNGAGCDRCMRTGYRGRVPLVEWVKVDASLRRLLRAGGVDQVSPVQNLEQCAREAIKLGLSDAREFERVFGREP